MPNRILKESICYSDDIESLSEHEEIFFYRLIVNCDDFGRCDARLSMLKSRLYPIRDRVISDDINGYLVKLIEKGMVQLYECKGVRYLQLLNWEKHQQVRAKRSKYPDPYGPDSNLISHDIRCNQMISHVTVIQSNPIQSESLSLSESESSLKKPRVKKVTYLDCVKLSDVEYQNAVDKYGMETTTEMIQILNDYKMATGKTYKSDYHTFNTWVYKRWQEDKYKVGGQKGNSKFAQSIGTMAEWLSEREDK